MQKEDYNLIFKKGRLTIDEKRRLQTEIEQGSTELDKGIPNIFIVKAHKKMKSRLAEEYYKTFLDGIKKIQSCAHNIDDIREYLKENKTHIDMLEATQATLIIDEITKQKRGKK